MITHFTFRRIYKLKGDTFWYLQRLMPFHRPSLPQIWELWVSYGLVMMPLCHGWGWHPPQIASHIHIRYIQSVLAIVMLSQGHIGLPSLYHFTAQVGPRFGNSRSLEEWNDSIASCLRLTVTSDHFVHPWQWQRRQGAQTTKRWYKCIFV